MSFIRGSSNYNTWVLFIQYAASLGVELTLNNAASEYFREEFDLTTESAATVGKEELRDIFLNLPFELFI